MWLHRLKLSLTAVFFAFCSSVIFLVFTERKKVSALLRSDVVLSCGFKQQEKHLAPEVDLEWRLQHRGKGLKVLNITTRLDDAEGSTAGKWCIKLLSLAAFNISQTKYCNCL